MVVALVELAGGMADCLAFAQAKQDTLCNEPVIFVM